MAERRKRVVRPWLWALGGLAGALLVVFVLAVGPWLFTRYPHHGLTADQELKAKNDVRTTLVQALAGLAVAGGLVMTYRTFRQNQAEQDRTYSLRQTEQVNEFYTKAVELLGHDQAPVRLGALYSLARLAQANPHQRQTVVDVLCAYLRMPYTPPERDESTGELVAAMSKDFELDPSRGQCQRNAVQELQVRLTAQRLLTDHLRRPLLLSGQDAQQLPPSPDEPFWPGISLDLTSAVLVNVDFKRASVLDARFSAATFTGKASFVEASFTGTASFGGATFIGNTTFYEATFTGTASFGLATFIGTAWFDGTTFIGTAWFDGAAFSGSASFKEATFSGTTTFKLATFADVTRFDGAAFSGSTSFGGTIFTEAALFREVTFSGYAVFDEATFANTAMFDKATFAKIASFKANVLHLDSLDVGARRVWPGGWTVRPHADDPTRGRLVPEKQKQSAPTEEQTA